MIEERRTQELKCKFGLERRLEPRFEGAGVAPSLHLTVMGTLVAAAIAAQQLATSSGSSIRLAPKQPAPATFSLHGRFRFHAPDIRTSR